MEQRKLIHHCYRQWQCQNDGVAKPGKALLTVTSKSSDYEFDFFYYDYKFVFWTLTTSENGACGAYPDSSW